MTQARTIEGKSESPPLESRPPLPPFTRESAVQKVRLAEDAWNSRNPEKVAMAYSVDSNWRNRSEFVNGRRDIVAFLTRKWNKELNYRLVKELWAFDGNRVFDVTHGFARWQPVKNHRAATSDLGHERFVSPK